MSTSANQITEYLIYSACLYNKNKYIHVVWTLWKYYGFTWISSNFLQAHCARTTKSTEKNMSPKSNMTCQIPYLDPFNPSVMKFIRKREESNCNRFRSCGKLVNGIFHITGIRYSSKLFWIQQGSSLDPVLLQKET